MNDKYKTCQWQKCQSESEIIYLGCGLCEKHWIKICGMTREEIAKKLDLEEKKDIIEKILEEKYD